MCVVNMFALASKSTVNIHQFESFKCIPYSSICQVVCIKNSHTTSNEHCQSKTYFSASQEMFVLNAFK